MSAKLKPLILPQLVQERKRYEDGQYLNTEMVEGGMMGNTNVNAYNGLFLVDNASMSDITSPATPTFSHRSGGLGHLRYSSSTSSLDLPLSLPSPSYSECPASPTAISGLAAAVSAANAGSLTAAAVKRPLPDVQEEDLLERVAEHEHEFGDDYSATHRDSYLYGCLCDEPCSHGRDDIIYERPSYDYDLGFVSDCEATANVPSVQRHRHRAGSSVSAISSISNATHDSSFSGLTLRFGSHIHALSRWRSKSTAGRRTFVNLTGAPASEPSLSRAPSRRSSSLSGQPAPVAEPMPVLSPALSSYYGSTESIEHIPTASSTLDDEMELEESQSNLERDRIKAPTPLLPPVFTTDNDLQQQPVSPLPPPSLQTSPLQTPAVASPVTSPGTADAVYGISPMTADAAIPAMSLSLAAVGDGAVATAPTSPTEVRPPPPLSRKFSTASFHVPFSTPSPPIPTAAASSIRGALEPHDEWCDRLGHANYTILPKPYKLPTNDTTDTRALHVLRDDWMLARTNYAKHLVRTGEHYGTTSNTYVLTEAKWAETDREWQRAHDDAMAHITNMLVRAGGDGRARAATLDQLPPLQHHDVSCVIPQILDNAEGKFPGLCDGDIVGPMDRVAYMEREDGGFVATTNIHGEKNGMSRFLRGLADRVRNRK
ncbi:hypothetical protein SEUCBS139899_009398 [Sporothrix eucalyptigena]|uniref:Only prolin and serin are matching in the corresponding protein n=1 Tax=Sporothrix eucalyptigena TaxID=1812306 RepID=A0ABP0D0H7_9PEZI